MTYFEFESLPVAHAVFGREGGVSAENHTSLNLSFSVGDDEENVRENQRRAFGLFERTHCTLVHAQLVHGNHVTQVSAVDQGRVMPQTDGLITNDPACGLTMNYGDCGSVFLYDPVNQAIGLGHAGWKGAICNLPGAMVQAMQTAFGSDPSQLIAALGPCISAAYYEVSEPVISEVARTFPKWVDRLLSYSVDEGGQKIGRPHFNLALANHINLYEADVKTVEFPNLCTAARTDLFFSHRAEKGKTGRFGAILTLDSVVNSR